MSLVQKKITFKPVSQSDSQLDDQLDSETESEVVEEDMSEDPVEEISGFCLCDCQCCTNLSSPYQPSKVTDSKVCRSYQSKHGSKSHSRMIQTSWYKRYPWITVCTSEYKIYCATCRFACSQGLLNFPSHGQNVFSQLGFNNWKKALKKFREHEASSMHREANYKLSAKSQGPGIDAQLLTQRSATQRQHRSMFMKLLYSVQFLARQGLSFRGHREDIEHFGGNLYQSLLLQAKSSPEMIPWLKQKEYISPEIVNEIITIMGRSVLRTILAKINAAFWFSVIADEAADISNEEQMSVSIRWVDHDYSIHEAPIGLVQLPDAKAATIFSLLKDVLLRCSLPITKCRGQAFDGASNMSGIRNGVQALVKKEESRALYVHCLAHNLNLCIKDVVKTCEIVRNCMDFVFELTQLIKKSPKRHTLFERLRKEVTICTNQQSPKLRMICPTRWTVRHAS